MEYLANKEVRAGSSFTNTNTNTNLMKYLANKEVRVGSSLPRRVAWALVRSTPGNLFVIEWLEKSNCCIVQGWA